MGMDTMESAFAGRRALVTGGAGFIGSSLARRLLALGAEVTLVDSLIPEYGGNLFNIREIADRVHLNISDMRDRHSLRYLVKGQDFLFNLAGQTSHMDSMTDPMTDLEINCRAQLSLLETCRTYNPTARIVFASTRQIYGRPEQLPVNERHPLRPVDVNGVNKLAGEHYHLLYSTVHGIPATVLRLTNTIGPGMRVKDARQTFVGEWVRCLLEGRTFEVWGGAQRRDFLWVDDAVNAFLLAAAKARSAGVVYNVGGSEVVELRSLADMLVEINGGGGYVVREFPEERRRIDIGDFYADTTAIRADLGWKPCTSLRESLERTIAFYRANLTHYI